MTRKTDVTLREKADAIIDRVKQAQQEAGLPVLGLDGPVPFGHLSPADYALLAKVGDL